MERAAGRPSRAQREASRAAATTTRRRRSRWTVSIHPCSLLGAGCPRRLTAAGFGLGSSAVLPVSTPEIARRVDASPSLPRKTKAATDGDRRGRSLDGRSRPRTSSRRPPRSDRNKFPLCPAAVARRPRITSAACAPAATTSPPPTCPTASTGSARAGVDAGADGRRPGARPLPRLRPAQQRADPALPGRVGPALPRRGPQHDRRPGPALPLRRRPGCRRRRPGATRRRVPGGDRRRSRALGRLRLRGLAQPLPLEPRRRPRLVPLRRGRIPGDRGGDPGGAARDRRPARAAGADGPPAPNRRAGRPGDGAHPRDLPRRLLGAALDGGRGRRGADRRVRGGRRLRNGRGRGRDRSRARRDARGAARRDRPRPLPLAEHPRHESHTLKLHPTPGLRIWSLSFAAAVGQLGA